MLHIEYRLHKGVHATYRLLAGVDVTYRYYNPLKKRSSHFVVAIFGFVTPDAPLQVRQKLRVDVLPRVRGLVTTQK